MTRLFCILLTLLFSLGGSAMGEYTDFGHSTLAPKRIPTPTTKDAPFGPKIADEVPQKGVPDNWSKSDIDDAIEDYKSSIETRRTELQTFDDLGKGSATQRKAHAQRITQEEQFLKSLEKARESRR